MSTRACIAALSLAVLGCPPSRTAISVTVDVEPAVRSSCIRVVARGASGDEVLSEPMVRKERLVVAVYSSAQLTGAVTLTARGYVGTACEEPVRFNDESAPVEAQFVKDEVTAATLTLTRIPAADDADGDGYRAASKGGPDCVDSNPAVNPGAPELCGDRLDNDCDTLVDCDAPTCEGFACDDANRCTTVDRCIGRVCTGTPLQCAPGTGQCAAGGSCDPATGRCVFTVVDAGTPCSMGDLCTGPGSCLVDGGCAAPPVACTTPPSSCFAPVGVCRADAGCTYAPRDAGTACNDNDPCTTADRCAADGTCAGTAVSCASPPGQCFGAMGTCNPADGGCVYLANTGASCDDSNTCTAGDSCAMDGTCAGTPFSCASPPGQCFSASGACLADGGCSYAPRDAGAPCDDGNLCTTGDSCSVTQSCDAVAVSCTTPPSACFAAGACDQDAGCLYSVSPGAACSDGDNCTLGDACLADGGCGAGTAFTCTTPPSECFGASGACQADGGCTYPLGALYQGCDGGACRADGGCAAPTFPYVPSNFNPAVVAAAGLVGSVTLNCAAVFDSSPDASTPFVNWCGQPQPSVVTVTQADGGLPAVVLGMYGLNVTSAGSLRVQGSRPVIFAIYDSATIAGPVLANAQLDTPGAGGSSTLCGAARGGTGGVSNNRGGGGGGGGFGTAGAAGGDGNSTGGTSGVAGTALGAAALSPLLGGCPGGSGGAAGAGTGGAGGGALQFSSAGVLRITSTVSVSGGGGQEGTASSGGGGGGGSGGGLLLEAAALTVTNTARLTANGGSGGEGADNGNAGGPGVNGATTTATVAQGGSGGPGGNGGNGGAGSTAPTAGTDDNRGGGGGGGAVGRIRVNGFGVCAIDAAAVVSPAASRQACP